MPTAVSLSLCGLTSVDYSVLYSSTCTKMGQLQSTDSMDCTTIL